MEGISIVGLESVMAIYEAFTEAAFDNFDTQRLCAYASSC